MKGIYLQLREFLTKSDRPRKVTSVGIELEKEEGRVGKVNFLMD